MAGSPCTDARDLLVNSSWYYSYSVQSSYGENTGDFVPMSWCVSSIGAALPAGTNTTYALGFNEPNLASQCNTSPAAAAAAFASFAARFPASTAFVSPALAGNGSAWLDAYLGNCTLLYGAPGCRVSFLAVHIYSCNTNSLMGWVSYYADRYRLPL